MNVPGIRNGRPAPVVNAALPEIVATPGAVLGDLGKSAPRG